MNKNIFFKFIIILFSILIFLTLSVIIYFYITKTESLKKTNKIRDSFVGTNTDKNNYIYDNELKMLVLKPNIEVTSARKINNEFVYNVKYKTDGNSFRYTKGNTNNNAYIFLGCSYMFGEGLNDNETLPYYFSELLNFKFNIINMGLPGTSTNVSYIILASNKIINSTNSKIDYIIYGFFFDHIYRNIVGVHQEKAFKLLNNNQLTTVEKGVSIEVFSNQLLRKYYKEEAINLTVKLIKEMDKLTKTKYNSKFLVFLYDINEDITKKIKEKLDELHIENIYSTINYSSKPNGFYMIKNECHPTGNANKENAKTIYNYIFKH